MVDDSKKIFDYYHNLFGVEKVRESDTGSIHVVDGFFNLAFLQRTGGEVAMGNTHRADGTEANQTPGINHFGFIVDKVDDVVSKLPEGLKQGESPQNGRPAEMRVIDPWGNNFDLSSRGFLAPDVKRSIGIRHVTIHADKPDEVAEFYKSVLDLKDVGRGKDGSILLSDGDVSMTLTSRRILDRTGIQYIGIQIDDWASTEARFEEFGFDMPLPKEGQTEVEVRDPEGNLYVMSQQGWKV